MKIFGSILVIILALAATISHAATPATADGARHWSLLVYRGTTASENLGNLFHFDYSGIGESIYSAELAYVLNKNNGFRRFLSPIMSNVAVAGNFALRHYKKKTTPEMDAYFIFRWENFPWKNYLNNTIALGEGVSYAFSIPQVEEGKTSNKSQKLLNYLMFELTFALNKYPNFQLAIRIHHRSSVFGLYGTSNAGSNNVGLAIRYRFH